MLLFLSYRSQEMAFHVLFRILWINSAIFFILYDLFFILCLKFNSSYHMQFFCSGVFQNKYYSYPPKNQVCDVVKLRTKRKMKKIEKKFLFVAAQI